MRLRYSNYGNDADVVVLETDLIVRCRTLQSDHDARIECRLLWEPKWHSGYMLFRETRKKSLKRKTFWLEWVSHTLAIPKQTSFQVHPNVVRCAYLHYQRLYIIRRNLMKTSTWNTSNVQHWDFQPDFRPRRMCASKDSSILELTIGGGGEIVVGGSK